MNALTTLMYYSVMSLAVLFLNMLFCSMIVQGTHSYSPGFILFNLLRKKNCETFFQRVYTQKIAKTFNFGWLELALIVSLLSETIRSQPKLFCNKLLLQTAIIDALLQGFRVSQVITPFGFI